MRDGDLGSDGRMSGGIVHRSVRPAVARRQLEDDRVRGRRLARPPGAGVCDQPDVETVVRIEVERHGGHRGVNARVRSQRVLEIWKPGRQPSENGQPFRGPEKETPARPHAVQEPAWRLADDGREDTFVQHETRMCGEAFASS